jgi:hypothetical protein
VEEEGGYFRRNHLVTDQAHIIDTGKESYRLQRTLAKNKGGRR